MIGKLTTIAALAVATTASFVGTASADLSAPTTTSARSGGGAATGYPTLVGVRWAAHPAYDRVVFDFTGGTPGWRVSYEPLVGEGTGLPIPLLGPADLTIHFHVARTATSLASRFPDLPTVRQIGFGGDFEGYVSAGLGLRDRVGFRAFVLSGPPRFVVDVAHQPSGSFGTAAVSRAGTAADVLVSGIRAGAHPGYDRVVFDVVGSALPTVRVAYISTTSIGVTFTALGSATSSPHASYGGPSPVFVGLSEVRSVSLSSVGAGSMTFRISTAARHGFRLALLRSPTRVVVDIAR